jgi:hypothetical protein
MSDQKQIPMMGMVDEKPTLITIDLRRLRMRDIAKLDDAKTEASGNNWGAVIPIIARVTGLTPDQVWDLDFETMMKVQNHLNEAMTDVLKKTNADS